MADIERLKEVMIRFRDERDWKQFHTPKDLALSLVLEAGEVMEHFQWKDVDAQWKHVEEHREEIGDELADVMCYMFQLSEDLKVDLSEAFFRKMEKNEKKYPVEKSKGRSEKYSEL